MLSEFIDKLLKIYDEKGDIPIYAVWTAEDDEGEEYTMKGTPELYLAWGGDELWITNDEE